MKYEIERHVSQSGGRACIVRTGWNVGWNPSHRCVIKLTYDTLLAPNARMANDNTFSISDVRDTANGLLRLAQLPQLTKIHLASTPFLVRHTLADAIIARSALGARMSYQPTRFEEIPYTEPRARLNHLDNSLAVRELGLAFRPAEEIIRAKVELLDRSASSHAA
jgi:dTDP-4-dehydrorhamnose reductase